MSMRGTFGVLVLLAQVGLGQSPLEQLEKRDLPLAERVQAAKDLARPELGLEAAEERSAALARMARGAQAGELRLASIEALAKVEGIDAVRALGELVRSLPAPEDLDAAKLLVVRLDSSKVVLDLLRTGFGAQKEASRRLRGAVLAELMSGFERAFVEAGESTDGRLLILARKHGDKQVRKVVDLTLEQTLQRLGQMRMEQRAVELLEGLVGSGWTQAEIGVRTALFLLGQGSDIDAAIEAARSVEPVTRGVKDLEQRRLRFLGAYMEALGELARDKPSNAFGPLMRAALTVDGINMMRLDLHPDPGHPSKVTGAAAAEYLNLRGLVDLTAAYAALVGGAQPNDGLVLRYLTSAHEFNLRSQLRLMSTDDNAGVGSFDELLEHNLGPRQLVFSAPDSAVWSGSGRGRGLDIVLGLGRAAALVLGDELPGFEPLENAPDGFGPARTDPRRFVLLKLLRPGELTSIQRRLGESWDPAERQFLELRRRAVSMAIEQDYESDYADLGQLRLPSTLALGLAADLNGENRAEEAVVLTKRLFDDLEGAGRFDEGAWGAWLAARVEVALGGALGDAGRAREATSPLESAVRRLEAVENTVLERKAAERDPRRLAAFDTQVQQTQRMRAQALVALAVNSNVRLGDAKQALVYFEAAYALDDSDFMRGLLACYRARFGAVQEARSLLRTIVPTPPVYYNLACAWALLGDADQALEMLKRELKENHPTPGSMARQKAWARQDPDLSGLLEDERFLALTGE